MIKRLRSELIQSRDLLAKAITRGDDAAITLLAEKYIQANASYSDAMRTVALIASTRNSDASKCKPT
jgi:hypothetical protein